MWPIVSSVRKMTGVLNLSDKLTALRLVTLWPFHDKLVMKKLEKANVIVVPELNMGQMVREIQRLFGNSKKIVAVNRWDGELITPEQLRKAAVSA